MNIQPKKSVCPDEIVVYDPTPALWHTDVEVGVYPDGMPLIKEPYTLELVKTKAIMVRPTSLQSFMAAMFLVDAARERNDKALRRLLLPMLPGARQDRLLQGGDYLFTAKSIAREINARKFDVVVSLDPHSNVMPALIDRHVTHYFNVPTHDKYDAVVAPDGGSLERATRVAKQLSVPLVHGWKKRDPVTGGISGFGCEETNAKKVLVVDDICDGGMTFVGLAQELQKKGVETMDLWVTHGIFSRGTGLLENHYRYIDRTDSVVTHPSGVTSHNIACDLLIGMETKDEPYHAN